MSGLFITPTEALLQVAKQHPFKIAVKTGEDQWSYAALSARVRQTADKITDLGGTQDPIGLLMGLEIDYVAAAHAIWLSGRSVVFLSSMWTPEVLQVVLERVNVHLILFGSSEPPAISGVRAVSTFSLVGFQQPPSHVPPPSPSESVEIVPLICSITSPSGSTGVPKGIVRPMRRSLEGLSEESSTLLQAMDGKWLHGGTTFLRSLFEIRRFMFNQTTLYLDPSTSVADQCTALCEELESIRNSQLLRVCFTPSVFRAFADFAQMRSGGSQLPSGFNRVYWMVVCGETLSTRDLELARIVFPSATIACDYPSSTTEQVAPFANTETTDASFILKHARDCLCVSHNDDLEMAISSVRCITGMPFSASCKIDLVMLQKMADSTEPLASGHSTELPAFISPASKVDALAEEITAEISKLSNSSETVPMDMSLLYSGLNSTTADRLYMWLQSEHEYAEEMTHLFEEEIATQVLATEILREEIDESDVDILAEEITAEITKLSKSLEPVPKDIPLPYSGLNSITLVRLYMWLQSEHGYEEEMTHLFEEEVTAEVLAKEILGYNGESQVEDSSTDSSPDTLVEDGASEVQVLEKDPDFMTEEFIVDDEVVRMENGLEFVGSYRRPKGAR